nr:hypothetical protein [Sinorhizobium meliloti]
MVCEMGEIDQITAAVDQVVAAYGRIDILVNNAFDRSAVRLRGSHRGQRS